ncbi:MAG: tetratricopeptide repeat protein [Acidobacteria bacterium]|nr:tetratricopeptide repeat protein [Acidobacteriota bacterium]
MMKKIRIIIVLSLASCVVAPTLHFLPVTQASSHSIGTPPILTQNPQPHVFSPKSSAPSPGVQSLNPGEKHQYPLELNSNSFLRVLVEQKGIDVVVRLLGLDGNPVQEADSPNGTNGSELLSLIVDQAGNYILEIESLNKKAQPGKYEIKIEAMRVATDQDRAQVEIQKLVLESDQLRLAGKYDQALPLIQQALEKSQKVFGPEYSLVASNLDNLAGLYQAKGDYAQAEPLFQRSLAIREKALGPDHPAVANSLNNLAGLYQAKGDYARVEPLYRQALAIQEKILGPDHLIIAYSLNNLAAIYGIKGDFGSAEQLYRRSLAIQEKALGPSHPAVANCLNNLAVIYKVNGDMAKAEPLFQQALIILEKAVGPDHPLVATTLYNLAGLYVSQGGFTKAELLYQRALAIREKTLGSDHPDVALCLNSLALLYWAVGNMTQAIQYQIRSNETTEHDLIRNLVAGSENQKMLYLKKTRAYTDQTISLHVQAAPGDSAAIKAALMVILRRKGRVLDAMASAIAGLRNQSDPEIQKLLDGYASLVNQISVLTLRGPGKKNSPDHFADLQSLEAQKEKLEAEISRRSVEFKTQITPITLENVQKLIPADASLVEYAVYRPYDPRTGKAENVRYVAYVLKPSGSGPEFNSSEDLRFAGRRQTQTKQSPPDKVKPGTRNPEPGALHWVDLGEAKPIEEAVNAFRQVVRTRLSPDVAPGRRHAGQEAETQGVKVLGRKLEALIFEPLRKVLGPTRRVLLSPDGVLNLVPFDALVTEKGTYLVEGYEFSYLTSGRDLLRLQNGIQSEQPPLVVANPDYADGSGPHLLGHQFSRLNRLAGTASEAKQLKALFPKAMVYLNDQAAETVVAQARRPEFLHIGTHGYFFTDVEPEPVVAAESDQMSKPTKRFVEVKSANQENPLLRSCLFLAGANKASDETSDGILTALETATLNLWGTKLVVLSACDTGVGDVKNGDGVYGLRRALVLAGSESQMVSLWPVSDTGTQDLMIRYYQLLKNGAGRSAALRQVRLEFLKNPRRRHPFYWASFIQSGEWRPLERSSEIAR